MKRLILTLIAVSLFGCGGGGGGGTSTGGGGGGGGTATSKSYKLSLQGSISAGSVGAVQFDLLLPASITTKPDISRSGVAPSGALVTAGFTSGALNVGAISAPTGFSSGEFATIVCPIPAGIVTPSPAEFGIRNLTVFDESGNSLGGVTVTIN